MPIDNNTTINATFDMIIEEIIKEKTIMDGLNQTDSWFHFAKDLKKLLGHDYKKFEPYISGNYAVFMQHGSWFNFLSLANSGESGVNNPVFKYISSLDPDKQSKNSNLYKSELFSGTSYLSSIKLSQSISDIQFPESQKEYIPISTRQKNSFVNTRDYVGSDFSINFIENKDMNIVQYHEAWHKVIDLVRDGKVYIGNPNNVNQGTNAKINEINKYLIENPLVNTVWIVILEPFSTKIKGLFALFGVLPVNMPLKTLIGDRNSPKIVNYSMNYKFMDMQYAFYDDWAALEKSASDINNASSNGEVRSNLAHEFKRFLKITEGINELNQKQ